MSEASIHEASDEGHTVAHEWMYDLLGLGLVPDADMPDGAGEGELQAGDVVGRYTLIRELGRGGFGIVWEASQTEPIKRHVALKIIKEGMNSRSLISRFRHERQALASMTHPFIATVLDAGSTANHRPYFAMELVDGVPITKYAKDHRLDVRQRIELMLKVCHAVQHAHQKGVLHRDLKPCNILVSEVDGQAVPKIIDFGIAKALHGEAQSNDSVAFTAEGVILGTPHYMSPEHATLGSEQVDVRADVYSLGAILYELLTHCRHVEIKTPTTVPSNELFRQICASDPVRPSTRLLAESTDTEGAARTAASLRGELDWLVLKALERSPDDRYASVSAMAEDLGRYLQNEPLSVGPPSIWYRVRKLSERYRMTFVVSAVLIVSITAIAVISTFSLRGATKARRTAEELKERAILSETKTFDEAKNSQRLAGFLADLLQHAARHVQAGKNPEALRMALDESAKEMRAFDSQPQVQVSLLENLAEVYLSMGDSARALPVLERQREISTELWGADDPRTARLALPISKVEVDVHADHSKALALLQDAVAKLEAKGQQNTRDWFEASRQMAQELSTLGKRTEALLIANKLAYGPNGRGELARKDPSFLGYYAEIQRMAGETDHAAKSIEDALAMVPRTSKSLAKMSTRARLLQSFARVEAQRNNPAKAAELLEECLELTAKARGDENLKLIDPLIEMARLHERAKHVDKALSATRQALMLAQKTGHEAQQMHALRATGDILEHSGRLNEALVCRRECESLGRMHAITPRVWILDLASLAGLLSKLGLHSEAENSALMLSKALSDHTDAFAIDPERGRCIYQDLVRIMESVQKNVGTHAHDTEIARWKEKIRALGQAVS